MLNINRIYKTIGIYEERIKTKNDKEKHDKLYKTLDISAFEMVTYQNVKSELFASNRLSLDVANFLYRKLRDYSNTSLAERIVLTLLFKEIMEKRHNL